MFEDIGFVQTKRCDKCHETFKNEFELNEHLSEHETAGSKTCSFCEKKFSSAKTLNSHSCSILNTLKVKCNDCGKTFKKHSLLQRHVGVHGKKTPNFVFNAKSIIAMAKDVKIR